MESVCQRSFIVNYFEKDENTWIIESHLSDTVHDIKLTLEVQVPEMIIQDAEIKFLRQPLNECLAIEQKAQSLIGANIQTEYRSKILPLFMGPEGCPNIMTLLGASTPGIPYFYYPYQIKVGRMNPDEWWSMVPNQYANDSLAHKLYIQKDFGHATPKEEQTVSSK
jgi:hypothetical protein